MTRDPIVAEIRAIRDAFAKEHGYEVRAIVQALQREEAQGVRRRVSLQPKKVPKQSRDRKAG